MLHTWIREVGEVWPFKCIFESKNIDSEWRSRLFKLMFMSNYSEINNAFHVAATCTHKKDTLQVVKFLAEAFKEEFPEYCRYHPYKLPWFRHNINGEGPLWLAIKNNREDIALYILRQKGYEDLDGILDIHTPVHKTIFLAVQNNCFDLTKYILGELPKESWPKYIKNPLDGQNVMHLAPNCKDHEGMKAEAFWKWLIDEAPSEFMTQQDSKGNTPVDIAFDVGATWFIQVILDKFPEAFKSAHLAWVKACENRHRETIQLYMENFPGDFRDFYIAKSETPLHHIELKKSKDYASFVQIPPMMDLINVQDPQGKTPLHKAIQKGNMHLTETLLGLKSISYTIKDENGETAMDLLVEKYKDPNWKKMCERLKLDPRFKTSFFQQKTNLLDVRDALFVVAALVATITFTAGFTLPGGLNQDTGEAMMAKRAAFLVFLLADTLGLCTSMLALICLVWSMVQIDEEYNFTQLLFIERSLVFLMASLYSTLLAFMSGVYVVISPKTLWPTILIIIMCSLIAILTIRPLLKKILFPISLHKKIHKAPRRDPESGHIPKCDRDCFLNLFKKSSNSRENSDKEE